MVSDLVDASARSLRSESVTRIPGVCWDPESYRLYTPGFEWMREQFRGTPASQLAWRRAREDFLGLVRVRLQHTRLLADHALAIAALDHRVKEERTFLYACSPRCVTRERRCR